MIRGPRIPLPIRGGRKAGADAKAVKAGIKKVISKVKGKICK